MRTEFDSDVMGFAATRLAVTDASADKRADADHEADENGTALVADNAEGKREGEASAAAIKMAMTEEANVRFCQRMLRGAEARGRVTNFR